MMILSPTLNLVAQDTGASGMFTQMLAFANCHEKEVRNDYIAPFQPAFPKAKILMRRPFDTGLEGDFGIYNDVFGDKSATKTWLN